MNRFLDLAAKQAARSGCRYLVGAVVTKSGRVLISSCNRYRNSPGIDFQHATFHAEEMALRRARHVRGAVIHVARINAAGEPRMARPCQRCATALVARGIIRAHYTTPDGPAVVNLT
ncbi:hypothetical protein [Streptomyces olivoreticuli]|uniref:hypothetical protein n=1 Tax=Streptomyces olivoreticuli TaxID=68246 RepID=UPI000E28055A|nr:hypothetical protein [Streptomyces olivoreticuli]